MCLSCTGKICISVLVCKWSIFQNTVTYASRKLSQAEKIYAQIQKEALAIIFRVEKFCQYLLGRKFCLITDHKPLLMIFHLAKGIPETAASSLQRWAIVLSAYNYEVKYQPSEKHGNADALSCLPLDKAKDSVDDPDDTVCLLEQQQLNHLPIKATDIQRETSPNPVLSKVYNFTVCWWPLSLSLVPNEVKPFTRVLILLCLMVVYKWV